MDFFDQHKALIITVLLFSVILLAMYNIRIYNSNLEAREMLVQLHNFSSEELSEKEERREIKPKPPQPPSSVETHRAFNTNKEENAAEFQSRLEEIFEENSANQESSETRKEPSNGDFNINQAQEKEPQQQSDGNNTSEETSAKKGMLRNSSISFNLLGRDAIDIPNPVYTCDTRGRIVVNITVDAQGNVTATSINEASSSSTNECLTNQALKYAAGAVFTALPNRNEQPGTITFNFQD